MDARVLKKFRNLVLNGEFGPNEPLTERVLRKLLNTGRTPVREALARLAGEGLLDLKRSGQSPTVRTLGESESFCIVAARYEVEQIAAKLISQGTKGSKKGVGELIQLHGQMEQLAARAEKIGAEKTRRKFVELDCHFHCQIVSLSNLDPEGLFMRDLFNRTYLLASNALTSPDVFQHVIREHERIVNAIKNKSSQQIYMSIKKHLKMSVHRWFPQRSGEYVKLL